MLGLVDWSLQTDWRLIVRKLTNHQESVLGAMCCYLEKLFAVENRELVIANEDNFNYWLKRIDIVKWSEFIDIIKEFGLDNGD